MVDLDQFARHSPYSDPGEFAPLLRDLGPDAGAISAAARNVIAHYRGDLPDLAEDRHGEIDRRWLRSILALDQARHPGSLTSPRPMADRVAGCCRDHSLFVVGALREHGIPARHRIGFAHYFDPGFGGDHVVVERWDESRWVRFDPELRRGDRDFDVQDMPVGPRAPFETAAEVWLRHRAGEIDPMRYGVFGVAALRGPDFIRTYVFFEVAHRYGDELLLWDEWEVTAAGDDELADDLARLLVAADRGDAEAEDELFARYRSEPGLRPGDVITQLSPYGYPPVSVRLDGGRSGGYQA